MKRSFALGTKIVAGYLVVVGFVAVTGVVGYWGIRNLAVSLRVVGEEEAPLVDMANEMKVSIWAARNAMEEFKGATSACASEDATKLAGIEAEFAGSLQEFDTCVSAMLDGARLQDGTRVLKTDNAELADLVRQADRLHNEKFGVASKEMMVLGKDAIARSAERSKAMRDMETAFDEVFRDASSAERLVSDEIARRAATEMIGDAARAILTEEVPVADMVNEIKTALAETRIALEEFVQARDGVALQACEKEYREKVEVFDRCVAAILKGGVVGDATVVATDNAKLKETVQKLDRTHTAFQEWAEKMMAAHRALIDRAAEADKAMAVLDRSGDDVCALVGRIEQMSGGEMTAARSAGARAVTLSVGCMLGTVAVAVFLGILLGVVLTRSITGSIGRVIRRLSSGSEQVTAASGEVSSASQTLAQGASEQASSLEETSAALEQMASMTRQNADNAVQADAVARQAQDLAATGVESMDRMVEAIERIRRSASETAKIIKTIDEIAFQTNLLALNAAVEAARAGEAGKGFAVVAEEVRNLARRSAEAARNTADLIDGAQKNAEAGVSVTAQVAKNLSGIKENVGKVATLIAEIAAASKEQSQGIDQVNTAVSEMDKVVQSNAASAEESASASEELSSQAQELNGMVADLTTIVSGTRADAGVASGSCAPTAGKIHALLVRRGTAATDKAFVANVEQRAYAGNLLPPLGAARLPAPSGAETAFAQGLRRVKSGSTP